MKELLTPEALLTNLKDVRALTRNEIEAFPEKELFEFSVANLRPTTKAEVLALWDRATEIIDREWKEVGDYTQSLTIYQMTFSFAQWILYAIENESHHRGQGYTYLRALGIEPPFFWARESFN